MGPNRKVGSTKFWDRVEHNSPSPNPRFILNPGSSPSCSRTFLLKYLGVQGELTAALCLSSPLWRSSRRCLCSVALSMFPSFSDLVTCCHNRLHKHRHINKMYIIVYHKPTSGQSMTFHSKTDRFCNWQRPLSTHHKTKKLLSVSHFTALNGPEQIKRQKPDHLQVNRKGRQERKRTFKHVSLSMY